MTHRTHIDSHATRARKALARAVVRVGKAETERERQQAARQERGQRRAYLDALYLAELADMAEA